MAFFTYSCYMFTIDTVGQSLFFRSHFFILRGLGSGNKRYALQNEVLITISLTFLYFYRFPSHVPQQESIRAEKVDNQIIALISFNCLRLSTELRRVRHFLVFLYYFSPSIYSQTAVKVTVKDDDRFFFFTLLFTNPVV
jgi:hypothetical protein